MTTSRMGIASKQIFKKSSVSRWLTFLVIISATISFAPAASSAESVDPCAVKYPNDGSEFQKNAAINSPGNEKATSLPGCTEDAYFTGYSGGNLEYQCPKYSKESITSAGSGPKGYLESANLTIDSRDNSYDPVNPAGESQARNYDGTGYYSDEVVPYKQTGHWGIQTCNWSEANTLYRITVRGAYKFDQTQPAGYGEADAECSTGFAPSSDPEWGLTSAESASTWTDKFVPPQYSYIYKGKHPNIVAASPDADRYGAEWKDHRFDYDFLLNKGIPGAEINAYDGDGFDLEIGWSPGPVTWTALEAGKPVDKPCSKDHVYAYDFRGTGRPIHLVLADFVRYAEWENCGTLSIHIQKAGSRYTIPSAPPYGGDVCHWVSNDQQTKVWMKDFNGSNLTHPYYFDAINYTTQEREFRPATGVSESGTVRWGNLGGGPHSVTSMVAKDGTFCTNVSSLGIDLGRDDCDRTGKQKLFDSNPLCPPDCTTAYGGFQWKVELTEEAAQRLAEGGYISIPYYCRVKPDEMRGTLVIRQNA